MVSAFCSRLMHARISVEGTGGLDVGLPRWLWVVWLLDAGLLSVHEAEALADAERPPVLL